MALPGFKRTCDMDSCCIPCLWCVHFRVLFTLCCRTKSSTVRKTPSRRRIHLRTSTANPVASASVTTPPDNCLQQQRQNTKGAKQGVRAVDRQTTLSSRSRSGSINKKSSTEKLDEISTHRLTPHRHPRPQRLTEQSSESSPEFPRPGNL